MTSCGAFAPCRVENAAMSLCPLVSTNEYSPGPVTTGVTESSTHVPCGALTDAASCEPLVAGLFAYAIVVSLHVAFAVRNSAPVPFEESVTNKRTFADTGVAGSAPTEKRKYGW